MIHGGLRYLERLHVGLVRESLRERAWLLEHLPELVKPLEILLPVYADSPRSRVTIRAGLLLYDALAGRESLDQHRSLTMRRDCRRARRSRGKDCAEGSPTGTRRSTISRSSAPWCVPRPATASRCASRRASMRFAGMERVDRSHRPRRRAALRPHRQRGRSLDERAAPRERHPRARTCSRSCAARTSCSRTASARAGSLLQSAGDRRVFFVLPWKGTTLVGTTEVAAA